VLIRASYLRLGLTCFWLLSGSGQGGESEGPPVDSAVHKIWYHHARILFTYGSMSRISWSKSSTV
jgi:hypothetical protein